MTDTLTSEQRHKCMSSIKSKNTSPEIILRKYLFSKGLRYRLHVKKLIGCPDIVLKKYNTVIFVHGCFWHRHILNKCFRIPSSNIEYWNNKIDKNRKRDIFVQNKLISEKWNVIIVWECELKDKNNRDNVLNKIYNDIIKNN